MWRGRPGGAQTWCTWSTQRSASRQLPPTWRTTRARFPSHGPPRHTRRACCRTSWSAPARASSASSSGPSCATGGPCHISNRCVLCTEAALPVGTQKPAMWFVRASKACAGHVLAPARPKSKYFLVGLQGEEYTGMTSCTWG